mgnify:CR=1 FL=1
MIISKLIQTIDIRRYPTSFFMAKFNRKADLDYKNMMIQHDSFGLEGWPVRADISSHEKSVPHIVKADARSNLKYCINNILKSFLSYGVSRLFFNNN